jgi:hypothetical protein
MVSHITTILQRFTGQWSMLLQPDAVLTVCRAIGYTAWRDRVLTPVTAMRLFLLQILHGNTACSHLPQRMVMCQSATLQHIGVERISSLDALRWLSTPCTGRPLVALIVNPVHPRRVEPRVKKRPPKSFPLMIKSRHELHQQFLQQGLRD